MYEEEHGEDLCDYEYGRSCSHKPILCVHSDSVVVQGKRTPYGQLSSKNVFNMHTKTRYTNVELRTSSSA